MAELSVYSWAIEEVSVMHLAVSSRVCGSGGMKSWASQNSAPRHKTFTIDLLSLIYFSSSSWITWLSSVESTLWGNFACRRQSDATHSNFIPHSSHVLDYETPRNEKFLSLSLLHFTLGLIVTASSSQPDCERPAMNENWCRVPQTTTRSNSSQHCNHLSDHRHSMTIFPGNSSGKRENERKTLAALANPHYTLACSTSCIVSTCSIVWLMIRHRRAFISITRCAPLYNILFLSW